LELVELWELRVLLMPLKLLMVVTVDLHRSMVRCAGLLEVAVVKE
jgi:hypothetical protein